MEQNARTLPAMLDALDQVGAPHAVFGGQLAILYGTRQRTGDIDMLVPKSAFEPLIPAFQQRGYAVRQFPLLLQIVPRGAREPAGDLVAAESNAALQAAFAARTAAEMFGLSASVLPRGVFVALKFEAALKGRRLSRDPAIDVLDVRGVLERGFGPEDERLAAEFARKTFPGAGADFVSFLDDLRHGRWPKVVSRARLGAALLRRQAIAGPHRGVRC